MKFLRIVMICAFVAFAAVPAQAFETPASSPELVDKLKEMGDVFALVAGDFGCKQFTWANFTDPQYRTAQLEYVPEGHDVKNWTRLQTTTVYAMSGRADLDTDLMNGLAKVLIDNYKKNGTVIDLQYFENGNGEPAFYIEYKIGEGAAQEHNAGVFMRTSDISAAFIQIQARKSELKTDDKLILLGYLGMAPKGMGKNVREDNKEGMAKKTVTLPRRKPVKAE